MMDVSETLKAPRVEKKLPGVLSPEEVERLMDAVQGTSPKELRDKAMLELLYATGIRVSELIGLKPVSYTHLRSKQSWNIRDRSRSM